MGEAHKLKMEIMALDDKELAEVSGGPNNEEV